MTCHFKCAICQTVFRELPQYSEPCHFLQIINFMSIKYCSFVSVFHSEVMVRHTSRKDTCGRTCAGALPHGLQSLVWKFITFSRVHYCTRHLDV